MMLDCVTRVAGIVSAALVVAVLQPVLLVLLLLAELPGGWAAVRAARIGYVTNFALADSHRRKWILTDVMAERHTAAEMRSFTLRHFMLARVARRDGAELSGGQWQRIAAARGFYRSAALLIMDEPTAALDARAEYALFSSIRGHADLLALGGQYAELFTLQAAQYNL